MLFDNYSNISTNSIKENKIKIEDIEKIIKEIESNLIIDNIKEKQYKRKQKIYF